MSTMVPPTPNATILDIADPTQGENDSHESYCEYIAPILANSTVAILLASLGIASIVSHKDSTPYDQGSPIHYLQFILHIVFAAISCLIPFVAMCMKTCCKKQKPTRNIENMYLSLTFAFAVLTYFASGFGIGSTSSESALLTPFYILSIVIVTFAIIGASFTLIVRPKPSETHKNVSYYNIWPLQWLCVALSILLLCFLAKKSK